MYMPHLVLELREGAKNTMSTWLIWRQIMYEYIYSIYGYCLPQVNNTHKCYVKSSHVKIMYNSNLAM